MKHAIVASMNLGMAVAKFNDVAKFINVTKSTAQLDLIIGGIKVINGKRATVVNSRHAHRYAYLLMDIMKSKI